MSGDLLKGETPSVAKREIKFRAWHREDKQMLTIVNLSFMKWAATEQYEVECQGFDAAGNHRGKFALDEVELMQFTGLKDKNGKEIYEGDIVEDTIGPMVVEWDNQEVGFVFVNKEDEAQQYVMYPELKIIGNIYENPELLKP